MASKEQQRALNAVRAIMRAVEARKPPLARPDASPAAPSRRPKSLSVTGVRAGAQCPNARDSLTSAPEGFELVPTRDPNDRAHSVFVVGDAGGSFLVPARKLGGEAKPRRYPRSSMTSAGVSFDSSFDDLHERQRRLGALQWIGLAPDYETLGAVLMRDRVQAGSVHIDREKRVFAVASVARLARGYRERGVISAEECDRLCAADGASDGAGVSADPE